MQPLGDHLGTDQNIDLPRPHRLEDGQIVFAIGGGVTVETRHPGLWKELLHLLLDPFRTDTEPGHPSRAAGRAQRIGMLAVPAVVAEQYPLVAV